MNSVLVLGGAGYIGSVLTPRLLAEGYSVTVIDRLMYEESALLPCCCYSAFEFIQGDITDLDLIKREVRRHDIIIPLAAIVGAPACAADPARAKLINHAAMLQLIGLLHSSQMVLFPTTRTDSCGTKETIRTVSQKVFGCHISRTESYGTKETTRMERKKVLGLLLRISANSER